MIKVIASDLDGTLLDVDHRLNHRTAETIRKACAAGIRFMIATGRSFDDTMRALEGEEILCDYIVNSGAEVRNPQKEILFSEHMKLEDTRKVYDLLVKHHISYLFCSNEGKYCIGDEESIEKNIIEHIFTFRQDIPIEEIKNSDTYASLKKETKIAATFEDLVAMGAKPTKAFIFSNDLEKLAALKKDLELIPGLAVASSFYNNLEVTDEEAQKGPVLRRYIESLGYTMEEVMVFGDSLNDYSMLSMDFGATIAMENADPQLKEVSRYVTKKNTEDGVAYTIEELLRRRGQE